MNPASNKTEKEHDRLVGKLDEILRDDDDDDDDFSLLFALKGHVEPTGTPVGFRVPSS